MVLRGVSVCEEKLYPNDCRNNLVNSLQLQGSTKRNIAAHVSTRLVYRGCTLQFKIATRTFLQ